MTDLTLLVGLGLVVTLNVLEAAPTGVGWVLLTQSVRVGVEWILLTWVVMGIGRILLSWVGVGVDWTILVGVGVVRVPPLIAVVRPSYVPLEGRLEQETPAISPKGVLLGGLNVWGLFSKQQIIHCQSDRYWSLLCSTEVLLPFVFGGGVVLLIVGNGVPKFPARDPVFLRLCEPIYELICISEQVIT